MMAFPAFLHSATAVSYTHLEEKEITVYTVVNCGYYEARQNAPALEIMKNWCRKCGLIWGIGVGVGGGSMMPMLREIPAGRGPRKRLSRALAELADDIKSRTAAPDIPVSYTHLSAELKGNY